MNAKLFLPLCSILAIGCVEVPEQPLDVGPGAHGAPPPGPGAKDGPGGPGGPQPPAGAARMQPKGFEVAEGEGVTISGTVAYEGQAQGTLRVDFLPANPDQGLPGAVHSLTLAEPGPFSVEAPKGYGGLLICAFVDSNDDGPSRGEPKVLLSEPLEVGSEAIEGVQLTVLDDWDKNHAPKGPKRMPDEMRGDGKAPPPGGPGGPGGPGAPPPPPEPAGAPAE
jgi:hypothetical protein